MQKGRIGAVISLAGIMLCWVVTAQAADAVIGSVLAVRGSVFADSGTGTQALTTNAPLHRGDTVVSSAGKLKIALNDGSIVSVAENTRFRFADHETHPGGVRARITLISGALRLFVTRITPTGRFEIETETAIAAVRGTDWLIEATPERTAVAVLRGVVAVTGRAEKAPATVILRSPGHGTDVPVGSAPTPPKPWGASRLADLLARVAF